MKLIINGDDLGYTKANTLGIIEAFRNGILRSTTALMNADHILEARDLVSDLDGLGIGVHLTLTLGKALTENKTLTDENGFFFKGPVRIWKNEPDQEEIYAEFKAQIERFIKVFGHKPTHLDGHHSVHDRTAAALQVSGRLSEEYGISLRGHNHYAFVRDFNGDKATREDLIKVLQMHENEDIEIMCHPGYCDLELYRNSSYSLQRVRELDVLCSDEILRYVTENGIELVHY